MSRAALVANLPDLGRKQDHKMDSVDLNLVSIMIFLKTGRKEVLTS